MESKKINLLGKIMGGLFIFSALPKLVGMQVAIDNFRRWHLSDEWRIAVAVVELIAGIALFTRLERVASLVLIGIMPAAVLVHIQFKEWMMVPMPVVFGALMLGYEVKKRP